MQRRFSSYHLTSAVHNARIAGEAEEALQEEGYGGQFKNESLRRWQPIHDSHVVTTFIESFAAIEAVVNEHISRPKGDSSEEIGSFRQNYPGQLIEEKSTLPKAQLVLRFSESNEFDPGATPFQDVDLLRRVRNHFVHHKHEKPSSSIIDGLETKNIDENPFAGDVPGFGIYLSYDCAKWAFESGMEFINEFHERLGIDPVYTSYEDRLRNESKTDWSDREQQW